MLKGTAPVVFEDNEAARFSLTSGATRNSAAALLVHYVWKAFQELDVLPWVALVPSAANPADAPSRLVFNPGRAQGWRKVTPQHPHKAVLATTPAALAAQLRDAVAPPHPGRASCPPPDPS